MPHRPPHTWQFEMALVGVVLVAVAILSGGGLVELVGAGAVLLSFGHAQVADRLAEAEGMRASIATTDHGVLCHRWAARYLVSKEVLWCLYFVAHGSWSALAGVALFLAYPLWRRWWRARHRLRANTIALVIVNALAIAYAVTMLALMCGCSHRDVKPDNVLRNVADPTPVYMSPEHRSTSRWDDFTSICVADCGCDSYCIIPTCGWPIWDGCHWNCGKARY